MESELGAAATADGWRTRRSGAIGDRAPRLILDRRIETDPKIEKWKLDGVVVRDEFLL